MIFDHRVADLGPQERALCHYAVKLTLRPGEMCQADVDELHRVGYDDAQVHLANQVISYFNYINRVADGLGVDHEPWMDGRDAMSPTLETWLGKKGRDFSCQATEE